MIQVNCRVEGMIGIHKEGMKEVKTVSKKIIQQKLEAMKFENKELQEDLKYFTAFLPMIKIIRLENRKEKNIELYKDAISFGRKQPDITITGNYPLYNMLKSVKNNRGNPG